MRDLFRKCFALLSQRPALLLPLVGATFAASYLSQLNQFMGRQAVHWLTGRSVLGFAEQPTRLQTMNALLMALPLSLCLRVIEVAVYFAAFVLTACLVRDAIEDRPCNWSDSFAFLRLRTWRVLLLGLSTLAAFGAVMMILTVLLNGSAFAQFRINIRFEVQTAISLFIVCSCLLWMLIPWALRLIAEPHRQPPSAQMKIIGRITAILALGMCLALEYYQRINVPGINRQFAPQPSVREFLIWPCVAVLVNFPMVLLWIILALLVHDEPEHAEIPNAT